jgi:hypothetical protein
MRHDVNILIATFGHDGEYSSHPLREWMREVLNRHTRLGYWEWVSHQIEATDPQNRAEALGCYIGHDMHGWYVADLSELEADETGRSVGFDGRPHFASEDEAIDALETQGTAILKAD